MEILIPLLNEQGDIIGHEEKLEVHKKGLLHLAFSVLVYNKNGEMLLQKRAEGKYHSASLWTNTTCGHPNPDESIKEAAHRRLFEEMGFNCELQHVFTFQYTAHFNNGLTENEIDFVFEGKYDGLVNPDPEEASDFKWVSLIAVKDDIKKSPENYTVWFQEIMKRL